MLTCYDKYEAGSCEAMGMTCVETPDGAECSDVCTQAEAESAAKKVVCNGYYLEEFTCVDLGEGDYHWSVTGSQNCEHGCDNATKACIAIHSDEYQPCSTKDGEGNAIPAESRCDSKIHLSCDYDYNSETYLYHAEQCDAECDASFGCYEACSTVGVTSVCEDSWHNKKDMCIED